MEPQPQLSHHRSVVWGGAQPAWAFAAAAGEVLMLGASRCCIQREPSSLSAAPACAALAQRTEDGCQKSGPRAGKHAL